MFDGICLQMAQVQRDQHAADLGWLISIRTWRLIKVRLTLRPMKRLLFRQWHLKKQQRQKPQQQYHLKRQTQQKCQQKLWCRRQQLWMHSVLIYALDTSDFKIHTASKKKNEVVQTNRASLPCACKKARRSQPVSKRRSLDKERLRQRTIGTGAEFEVVTGMRTVDSGKEKP